jgi:hypothetical protein
MAKILVNTKDTDPGQPPSLILGSMQTTDLGVRTEGDLVREVYRRHGSGGYNLLVRVPGDYTNRKVWSGRIEEEDSDSLVYHCSENRLESLAGISVPEKPSTGVLKRVDRPKVERLQN